MHIFLLRFLVSNNVPSCNTLIRNLYEHLRSLCKFSLTPHKLLDLNPFHNNLVNRAGKPGLWWTSLWIRGWFLPASFRHFLSYLEHVVVVWLVQHLHEDFPSVVLLGETVPTVCNMSLLDNSTKHHGNDIWWTTSHKQPVVKRKKR